SKMSKSLEDPGRQSGVLAPRELLRKSIIVYGVMAAIGLAVMQFGHKNLGAAVALPSDLQAAVRLVMIGGLGAFV
ncbi:hypothetical protein ACSTLD_23620, partial [Vibrio parahaemolyticus]